MAFVFSSALPTSRRYLPGGAHRVPSTQRTVETLSVSKSNVVSERDFAKLDRLLCEKPNSTTLSLKAMICFPENG